jgi:hypothetical protein
MRSIEPITLLAVGAPCYVHHMPALPRVVVIDGGQSYDVLEVIELADGVVRARTAFLFEVGEELTVRIEADGKVSDAIARVRGHVGDDAERLTELELAEQSEPRTVISG